MSYKVIIPKNIKHDIAAMGLPRKLLLEVYNRLLQELPGNPDSVLGEQIIPLAHTFAYHFVLLDNERMPHQHVFMFAIERDDKQAELRVIGCRHTTDEAGEN